MLLKMTESLNPLGITAFPGISMQLSAPVHEMIRMDLFVLKRHGCCQCPSSNHLVGRTCTTFCDPDSRPGTTSQIFLGWIYILRAQK